MNKWFSAHLTCCRLGSLISVMGLSCPTLIHTWGADSSPLLHTQAQAPLAAACAVPGPSSLWSSLTNVCCSWQDSLSSAAKALETLTS